MQAMDLLTAVIERGGSDLHLNPGRPPVVRIHGDLVSLPGAEKLDDAAVAVLARQLCNDKQWAEIEHVGALAQQPPGPAHGLLNALDTAPITEGVGGEVHHPHHQGALTPAKGRVSPQGRDHTRAGTW